MQEDSREALLHAVAFLVDSEDAGRMYQALEAVLRLGALYPVKLDQEAATLNPLLRLGRKDSEAYARVISLVDTKRLAAGKDPLAPAKEEKFDKSEYMREFMDQKRQRQRRAAMVENMARPERDALKGRARLDFMDAQAAKWKTELDARLDRARSAAGGKLPKEVLDRLRTQFWAWVDEQIDEAEEAAKNKIRSRG